MNTSILFDRYYFSRHDYVSGTTIFYDMVRVRHGSQILELGPGPSNDTSDFWASLGTVTGLDVSEEARTNRALAAVKTFDGSVFPFADCSFDTCVSRYVLEHVEDCSAHFREVARVLRPGGRYYFITPNALHYVTLFSRLTPHWVHVKLVPWLQGERRQEEHDPWPTHYRCNSTSAIRKAAQSAGLVLADLRMVESEPSYGAAHPLLFYPMMAYERAVNKIPFLSAFRSNIIAAVEKR